MAIGVSFVPTAQGQGQPPETAAATSPIQKAIQFLSLRLPRVIGAGQVVPTQLLAGPAGGAGTPMGAGEFGGPPTEGGSPIFRVDAPASPPTAVAPTSPLQAVLAGQPGSAAAMIQAIDQATLPVLQKKKGVGIGAPAAQGFPAPQAAPPLPQPTSPQPLPQPNTAMELGPATQIPKFTLLDGQKPGFPFGLGGANTGA